MKHRELILLPFLFTFTFLVGLFALSLFRVAPVEAAGGPSPCIKDPIDLGYEKRLLPLPSECKGYDYCGRGEQKDGEYAPSPACVTPKKIVMHTTWDSSTTVDQVYNYFAGGSEGRHVGAHFVIDKSGKVLQMVEMGKTQVEYAQAVGPTQDHISIEMTNSGNYNSKSEMPPAQYQAALKLVKTLMDTYHIPLSTDDNNARYGYPSPVTGVFGHYNFYGPAGDPGVGWMKDFRADLPSATGQPVASSSGTGSSTSTSCWITAVGKPTTPKPVCQSDTGGSAGNFVYYCQGDPRWANTCDIGNAGCGPTSLAMIMSTFGVKLTPPEVDKAFNDNNFRACGFNGSDIYGAIKSTWFANNGFTVAQGNLVIGDKPDLAQMQTYLSQGYLLIVNADGYPCKGCVDKFSPVGHIFVVDQVDVAGKRIHTRDPNNCSFSTGEENPDPNLAWTDLTKPTSAGGGSETSFLGIYAIKKK